MIILIQYYIYLKQQTITIKMNIFDKLLNQYQKNAIISNKNLMQNYFQMILKLYSNYLWDLKLYVNQMKRFLSVLIVGLVFLIGYLTHFLLFYIFHLPTPLLSLIVILNASHFISIIFLIFSSSRISSFNKQFSTWYQNLLQHCCASQYHFFTIKQYFKVS